MMHVHLPRNKHVRRRMSLPFPFLPAVAVLWIAGCGGIVGCGRAGSQGKSAPAAPRVEIIKIQPQDLTRSIEMPATVEGYYTADLFAKVGGYLEEILVDIGDPVQKEQPLARIDVPEMAKQLDHKRAEVAWAKSKVAQARSAIGQAEAEVRRAQAGVEEAQSERTEKEAQRQFRQVEHGRVKKLVESGALLGERLDEVKFQFDAARAALGSAEARVRTAGATLDAARASLDKVNADLESAQANIAVAEADYEQVRIMLQYTTIRAPFDGVVTKRWVHPGAFIQPAERNSAAQPLLSVARTDLVRIVCDLPMAEVGLLNRGDRVVFDRINVLPGEKYEGQVTRFSGSLDVISRMMRVEIDLDNPHRRLMPGYYGYVTIFLERLPDTPVVPSSALLTEGTETFVYVVEGGVCRKRVVVVNYQDGTIVGIARGLSRGEQVVRAGGGQLADGQEVVPIVAEMSRSRG